MEKQELILKCAQDIQEARRAEKRLGRFSDIYPEFTKEDAYDIQDAQVKILEEQGIRNGGYKAAYTSAAIRKKSNIFESCFGHIPENLILNSGEGFPLPEHGILKSEPEVIIVMKDDLKGPRVTLGDVMNAVLGWMPGFELVVPVYTSETPDLHGEIAENMSFGALVPGNTLNKIEGTNWDEMKVRFYVNGELTAENKESSVMDGGPLNSVVMLANHLLKRGDYLKAGDMVLTGTPVAPVYLKKGDTIKSEFICGEKSSEVSITIR